ncbi:serine hydrolase domain-containing protein [Paenibacillus allorhizosphaerae]|uniref:D-alanyl-D-alanine carboxypeptidase n=1 Tax=Paenibacillus allorhizosphaerae TaxID=2849866 RepID=A0ABN7TA62_9BACL|nr:serine hydrolase domain-containing protein [Paenibacillus allorhizosphaerae]CAG7615551.1 Putative D-alanyl-D-alanine carboxypeptidase [Paenibacillus allorhizosphaerae]
MKLRYGNAAEAGMCESRISKLENLQEQWVERGVAPIMISLIARKGIIVSHKLFVDPDYDKSYGPMKLDTIFQLASISKPVTASAVMLLVEEGKVALELPVQDYIPEFTGENKEKVLVHHLMTHTSGIAEDWIWEMANSGSAHVDMEQCPNNLHPDVYKYLTTGHKAPLNFYPGSEMNYCGYGFLLLTEIIRRVTGQNIHEFATERMFQPLGMNDTYYIVPPEQYARVAKHPPNAPFPRYADYENVIKPMGGSGLCSTVHDMAIFGQTFLNKGSYDGFRLLSKLGVQKMTMNQIPGVSSRLDGEFFKEACWGLGWGISGSKQDYTGTLRSAATFSHTGRGNTLFMVDPENELITLNFQVTMKRVNNRPYHYFEYFNNAALASILD